jgi:valyl-tRNA synthetase
VIVEIRQNRAANKIDKSQSLDAELSAEGAHLSFLRGNLAPIERLGNVKLTIASGTFALKLNIPVDRARLARENAELEKVIANSRRQLDDTDIVAKMPEKVVAMLRSKLAGYEAQLKKNLDSLNGA